MDIQAFQIYRRRYKRIQSAAQMYVIMYEHRPTIAELSWLTFLSPEHILEAIEFGKDSNAA
ncbi:MAG TPA: hypothetical protein VFK44_09855 [Bacillales bacterium]|nr:hypothetical protein [Bacillales bacterium]